MKVGTVVVTHNRKELLLRSIHALLEGKQEGQLIFIIDNASDDGTKEAIAPFVDNQTVFYYPTGGNYGGSYGFNYGMKLAFRHGCDYAWLMDDDCIVRQDSLEKLLAFLQQHTTETIGFLSSHVLWKDGSISLMNVQKTSLGHKITDFTKDQPIRIASFVSCLVNLKAAEEVGLPIKDFFVWGDDVEYTYRVSEKFPSYFVADSIVEHHSAVNSGVNIVTADADHLERYRYAYRNESYFYTKSKLAGKTYLFLKICLHTARILFKHCNHKFRRLHYVYHYTFEGKRFHPHIEYVFSSDKKINVLEMFGEPLSYGGQEAFFLNSYRCFQDKNIHYTFATPFYADNAGLKAVAADRGDEVIAFNYRFQSPFRKRSFACALKQILKKNSFDVVHLSSGSTYVLAKGAKLAKKRGAKKVIVHSHAPGFNNFKYRLAKKYADPRLTRYADGYFACSVESATLKFPPAVVEKKKYRILMNGVDLDRYHFNAEIRQTMREKLKLGNAFTLIHVGRFSPEKNQTFFLSILPQIQKAIPDFRFLMIGDGDSKQEFIDKITAMGLRDHFQFFEKVSNVNELLMAGDVYLMPSLYEGLSIALVEAESSGLPCLVSTNFQKEGLIVPFAIPLSLSDPSAWVSAVLEQYKGLVWRREDATEIMKQHGFDVRVTAKALEDYYRGVKDL